MNEETKKRNLIRSRSRLERERRKIFLNGIFSSRHLAGARVLYVGGNGNNGANAGSFYVNANNGLTNSNSNIGCRLAEYEQKTQEKISSPFKR